MKHSRTIDKLAKMLAYILGRQPDEFGLIPDADGYVKTKDLVKALSEEDRWRHVRLNHIREVIHTQRPCAVEMADNRIRSADRSRLHRIRPAVDSPKLLYHAIRQRAHAGVAERGIVATGSTLRIVLAADVEMARRIGRRIDAAPVILTVNTRQAADEGVRLWRFGKRLFLADSLPLDCFQAPPVPKTAEVAKQADKPAAPQRNPTPGSLLLNADRLMPSPASTGKARRQRKNEWKRYRKRKHRGKSDGWPD